MYLKLIAELAISMLAAFGACALFRICVTARFLPKNAADIFVVDARTDVKMLEICLQRVREGCAFRAREMPLFLLERGADPRLEDVLRAFGARYVYFK